MVTRLISSLIEYIEEIESINNNKIQNEIIDNYKRGNEYNNTYYKYIISKSTKSKHQNTKYKLYFRGHSRQSYKLIPSVFRGTFWNKEDYFYHQIMVNCPEHFQFSTHLDKLVTMQHYGCPTRLLDMTTNPLVALYFACISHPTENGEVIIFVKNDDDIVFSDSDRAVMLSCLARFSNKDKAIIYQQSMKELANDKYTLQNGGYYYRNETIEKLFHEITIELPSFKRKMKPIDLLMPLFVQPNKTNGRILKQEGAFIISGLSENAYEAEQKLISLTFERIYIDNKTDILKQLEALGIHEASLFPEVDRVAEYLKRKVISDFVNT